MYSCFAKSIQAVLNPTYRQISQMQYSRPLKGNWNILRGSSFSFSQFRQPRAGAEKHFLACCRSSSRLCCNQEWAWMDWRQSSCMEQGQLWEIQSRLVLWRQYLRSNNVGILCYPQSLHVWSTPPLPSWRAARGGAHQKLVKFGGRKCISPKAEAGDVRASVGILLHAAILLQNWQLLKSKNSRCLHF